MKKILAMFFAATLISSPVLASRAPSMRLVTPTVTGNDISYPQCSANLPSGQAFGIVGVNGGLATSTNPCLAKELTWAAKSTGARNAQGGVQPKISLYVNTGNPGGLNTASWPSSNVDPLGHVAPNAYGVCDHSNSAACAWQYGWNRSAEDAYKRGISSPASYAWWLDVETGNTWDSTTGGTTRNAADLEGMVAYFHSISASIGVYSTAYQWGTIAGQVSPSSNLNGLASWLPGASNLSGAQSNCNKPSLTYGGKVAVTQWTSGSLDYDYACR